MICSNCSFPNKEGVAFCGRCGEKLAAGMSARTTTGSAPAAAAAVQTQKARQFCGKCGSELRVDGSCLRCSIQRVSRPGVAAPAPVNLNLPKIPTRTVLLASGAIGAIAIVAIGGKAVWGESLVVRTNVPGATVLVDGQEKGHMPGDGVTPLSIGHLHGKLHTVVVKADGYRDAFADVSLPNRMTGPLQLYLVPKPAGLRVHGLPGSLVFLNNQFAGRVDGSGSWSAPNLQPADYQVSVRQQGYVEWTHNATLKPGEQASLSANQPEVPLTPEQKQAKAMALFESANQKFLAGHYAEAYADCLASVEQGAGEQAQALCPRIKTTMDIVNGVAK